MFNLGPAGWWRAWVRLTVNLVFLTSFSPYPLACLPFVGFIALGYAGQALPSREMRGRWGVPGRLPLLAGLVVAVIGVFVWLKRYSFVPGALLLDFPYILVGLSYVFFRVLHVVIDRQQGAISRPINPLAYLNYTLDFTCLVSGPIQRYQDYSAQTASPPLLDLPAAGRGMERIVTGYFKVAIVSMLLGLARRDAIEAFDLATDSTARIAAGVLSGGLYPLYLYANFSGYVDVVIGVACFFRIILPENFNRPFSAENFMIFWSRWHITLSDWLKTYVYNPLLLAGLNRAPSAGPAISVGAFFVTFFLVGLWHGQTAAFLFFGVLQGGGVAANKLYQLLMQAWLGRTAWRALTTNRLYRACTRGLTFTWFSFTLLWFWSDWPHIVQSERALGPGGTAAVWFAILTIAIPVLATAQVARSFLSQLTWNGSPILASRYLRTSWCTALVVLGAAITTLLALPAPDIVYRSF